MEMPSYPSINFLEVRVPHLPLLCCFLHCSLYQFSSNSISRATLDKVNCFLVTKMLPESIGCKNDKLISRLYLVYGNCWIGTKKWSLKSFLKTKLCVQRLSIELWFFQIYISNRSCYLQTSKYYKRHAMEAKNFDKANIAPKNLL